MTFIINPGSGPVAGADFETARTNMVKFCEDLIEGGQQVSGFAGDTSQTSDDGRFTFFISVDDFEHQIDMPGIPIDEVRWMGEENQDIWDFPRLYVDGSSWIWMFALNVCGEAEDEDE